MDRWVIPMISMVCVAMPMYAFAGIADWQPYHSGNALELSLDRNAIWQEKDGLVHFINQERFVSPQFDAHYRIHFAIRRTRGFVDCARSRYVLTHADFYTASNRLVWASLFPLPRHAWNWVRAPQGSVAHSMVTLVCQIARTSTVSRKAGLHSHGHD